MGDIKINAADIKVLNIVKDSGNITSILHKDLIHVSGVLFRKFPCKKLILTREGIIYEDIHLKPKVLDRWTKSLDSGSFSKWINEMHSNIRLISATLCEAFGVTESKLIDVILTIDLETRAHKNIYLPLRKINVDIVYEYNGKKYKLRSDTGETIEIKE